MEKTLKLEEKVTQILQEIRIVLPGTQALLGFQLAAVFQQDFSKLPLVAEYTHLISLGSVCLATILLMTPAAYSQIVEKNTVTEAFHVFTSRLIVLALLFLSIGLAGDIFVVTRLVTGNTVFSVTAGLTILLLSSGLWFGYSWVQKK